ncbi:MAG: hypothetical protein K9G70_10300 [Prolixibacteraceae bacterium]|nr:hypothetical protein [Prolixibacteraceae bacterium]
MRQFNIVVFAIIMIFFAGGCSPKNKKVKVDLTNTDWSVCKSGDEKKYPAEIPGCIHTDLMNSGVIEDPFYRTNDLDVQWIDKEDWVYTTSFIADKAMMSKNNVDIVFEGIDTFADVFINDSLVGKTKNMFRTWKWDIKPYLKQGGNSLKVYIHSPIKKGIELYDSYDFVYNATFLDQSEIGGVGDKKVAAHMRKAQYQFGWDWGPRLVTSGIWKPVYIKAFNDVSIEHVAFSTTKIQQNKAIVKMQANCLSDDNQQAQARVFINNTLYAEKTISLNKGENNFMDTIIIENPDLWWPRGHGEQPMYNAKLEVTTKKTRAMKEETFGIRTVELVREKDNQKTSLFHHPDSSGVSIYFKINGKPVFAKGANIIPLDNFVTRPSKAKYDSVIQDALDANMNMLRVWGGGIYEYDYFYDRCSEEGILVWQDFMFACKMYPGNQKMLNNIAHEVKDNVIRLRNQPSVVLWCGNNEILGAWFNWGWSKQIEEKYGKETADRIWNEYKAIFHETIPNTLDSLNVDEPYWSSSPSAGMGNLETLDNGDMHYWGVFWGNDTFEDYRKMTGRFMSEYGFQSFPAMHSLKKFALPQDLHADSEVMLSHQRSMHKHDNIMKWYNMYYPKAKDFESFVYASQVLQAKGMKIAMESHRAAMPYCMGSLYWQLNDCWPAVSWSSVDFYGRWKAFHYLTKKAYQPLIIVPLVKNNQLSVKVVSDSTQTVKAKVVVKTLTFSGDVRFNKELNVELPANTSTQVLKIDKEQLNVKNQENSSLIYVELLTPDGIQLADNSWYFKKYKELEMPVADVKYSIKKVSNNKFEIKLETNALAKAVYIKIDADKFKLSDNFFDMMPESVKTVELTGAFTTESLKNKLTVHTLIENFE